MLFVTFAAFVLCPAKALDVYLAELAGIGNPVNDDVNVSVLGFAFVISYQAEFDFFEVGAVAVDFHKVGIVVQRIDDLISASQRFHFGGLDQAGL